jgi:lysozyme
MNDPVVDLSHWNSEPDWEMLKTNGTVGVILKATQGTGYVDNTFTARADKARKAGLMVASYHFLEHGNIQQQMDWYLSKVNPSVGDRLVIDYEEDPSGTDATFDELEEAAEYLMSSGEYQVAVYGSGHLVSSVGSKTSSILSKTSLWQARYSSSEPQVPTSIWPRWDLWQYTQEGEPTGCVGLTDCNKWNPDAGNIELWFNFDEGIPDVDPDDKSTVNVSMDITAPQGTSVALHFDVTAPKTSSMVITVNGETVADVPAIS